MITECHTHTHCHRRRRLHLLHRCHPGVVAPCVSRRLSWHRDKCQLKIKHFHIVYLQRERKQMHMSENLMFENTNKGSSDGGGL